MMNAVRFGSKRAIHIVDNDHSQRATLAMKVADGGGHAEIYEDVEELRDARPTNGAVLIAFPDEGMLGLQEDLAAGGVYLPIIVFADCPSPSTVVRAAHEGAADFLDAAFSGDELMAAYDYSQRFVERSSGTIVRKLKAQDQVAVLSDRERQILCFLLEGHSNKSMGKELNLSPRTVEDYRLNAIRKLGVSSTSAAIRIGIEAGLRSPSAFPALEQPLIQRASELS